MNLVDIFYQNVQKQPQHPLIIGPEDNKSYSYADFHKLITQTAEQLKKSGVKKGDSLALHYPSGPAYITLTYAIWSCGAYVVPIPTELVTQEKEQIFKNIHIDKAISKIDIASDIMAMKTAEPLPLSDDSILIPVKNFREHPAGFEKINTAFIRFSSGTTGDAKGVVLSHETIYERICAANQALKLNNQDRIVWLLSMAYHFAVSIVAYLSFGASIVFCKNHFGATIIKTAAKHNATLIYGSPTHYELMSHDKNAELPSDLRMAIATTTYLRKEISDKFYARFKKPLNETYGIIEIGLPCINFDKAYEKRGSVGRLLPDYEILMEDSGMGNNLHKINIRGKGLLDAYYEPWKTRENILQLNNGWFFTGDLGEVDNDGYLYIRGRYKEVISVGGLKFFPQEVEAVLGSHPGVREACVFGYHDKRLGEVPYAFVVKKSGDRLSEQELKDFCIQHLATYKIPEKIEFVDKLAKTASGKPIRNALKLIT